MCGRIPTFIAVLMLFLPHAHAQKKSIIPRDSITGKYTYQGVVDVQGATLDALRKRLEAWSKQHYNPAESKFASVVVEGDSYTLHEREALPGKARKFIDYDLVVDLKEGRYRYKLGRLEYTSVGKYPLEDKMATDKKSDLEAINTICQRIISSLEAAMKRGDDW